MARRHDSEEGQIRGGIDRRSVLQLMAGGAVAISVADVAGQGAKSARATVVTDDDLVLRDAGHREPDDLCPWDPPELDS